MAAENRQNETENLPLLVSRSALSVDASRGRDRSPETGRDKIRRLISRLWTPATSTKEHPRGNRVQWVPEEDATWTERMLFRFVDSLIGLGWAYNQNGTALELDDLWDVAEKDRVQKLSGDFDAAMKATEKRSLDKKGSVLRALWACHKPAMIKTAWVKVLHDILQFTFPVLLRWMLRHLQDGGSRGVAVLIAVLMLGTLMWKTVLINQYFNDLFRVGTHIKAQLIHMLFCKALRITEAAKAGHGVGGIVNLQSNDASKIWDLPSYIHILWSGPLQIAIAMFLLASVVGPVPASTAFLTTLILVPLSTAVGRVLLPMRKKLIAATDARVKAASEVVTGIKAIKLYAWEEPYADRINQLRAEELSWIRKVRLVEVINKVLFNSSPIITTVVTFVVYTRMGYPLTPDVAFTALSLFGLLRFPVSVLPRQIMQIVNAHVALKRIQGFMDLEEVGSSLPPPPPSVPADTVVHVGGASFSWTTRDNPEPTPVLSDISLTVRRGELVVVVGEVGAGKSSMLQALLGELRTLSGSVSLAAGTTVAYTAQDTWIQNTTVRENILMGLPYNEARYQAAVEASALLPDLRVLAAGDETEIGEKGVNLSGGQKQRVALARAVYADADLYLMDDPLSAVDAHVQGHLMRRCICGVLADKTRILVTHQVQHARVADKVVVVEHGRITHVGTAGDLQSHGVDLRTFCHPGEESDGSDTVERATDGESDSGEQGARTAAGSTAEGQEGGQAAEKGGEGGRERKGGEGELREVSVGEGIGERGGRGEKGERASRGRLVNKEMRQVGQVKTQFYRMYLGAWSKGFTVPATALAMAIATQLLLQIANWWLKDWSAAVQGAEAAEGKQPDEDPVERPGREDLDTLNAAWYLGVYNALSIAAILAQTLRSLSIVVGSLGASRRLHEGLLGLVLRLPMRFFEVQPAGRLLNRFTRDLEKVDMSLGNDFESLANFGGQLVFNALMVTVVSPPIALLFGALSFVYLRVLRIYVATSREVKRVDSVQNSPIFSHFNEIITGITTVRAFGASLQGANKNEELVNKSTRAHWPSTVLNRWLSVQLEMVGNVVIFVTALLTCAVGARGAGMAGLALASAVNLTGLLNWVVRCVSDVEVDMNAVERICEYLDEPTEAPLHIPGKKPSGDWPHSGVVDVQGLVVRYRADLEPALKGVSFVTRAREKVGLVGRTGCGKSTLMMAIFRIIEPSEGRILIDGIDTSALGLFDLRSRLALVPQDPVVFSGTIRSNLDPFGTVPDDASVWQALSQVHLSGVVKGMGGLDASVSEGGNNLSVGQRQLLCMARALLRSSRILLLDEATSNVDGATDAVIQRTIREAFRGCTVLTIAHRLNTIMDYDRILVLDQGRVLEFDPPRVLLSTAGSSFASLVRETESASGQA